MVPDTTFGVDCKEPAGIVEAAILFSAGYDAGALQVLEAEAARWGNKTKAWFMLQEIHHIHGDRRAFESVGERFEEVCGGSLPSWSMHEHQVAVPGTFELAGVIGADENVTGLIEYGRAHAMVGIDMGRVERIGFQFAPQFCALLRMYANQGKRIILGNIRETHAQLLAAVGGLAKVVLLRPRITVETRLTALRAA